MRGRRLMTTKRIGIAALGVLGLLMSTMDPVTAQVRATDPPPGQMTMNVVSANGNGCPRGTTTVVPNGDKTAFTVTYSNYTAQNGGGVARSLARAACVLTVDVGVPPGFTFGITRTTYRGYADLQAGATGSLSTQYWFVGQPVTGEIRRQYRGVLQDNWQATDSVPIASISWMPCRRTTYPLNIQSQLVVNAGSTHPGTTSLMTMDATDSEITTIFNITWRAC